MDTFDFNQAVFLSHEALMGSDVTLKRSQVGELLAAALGYRTYAALALENADESLDLHLEDADHVILSDERACLRLRELMPQLHAEAVHKTVTLVIDRITAHWPCTYAGIEGFWSDHLQEFLADAMTDADETSQAQAESNAYFPNSAEVDEGLPEVVDLWSARDEWVVSAGGSMIGAYDPDGDRMFNGDTLRCTATVTFSKAGRAGLVEADVQTGAAALDDWRDEEEYYESMAAMSDPSQAAGT